MIYMYNVHRVGIYTYHVNYTLYSHVEGADTNGNGTAEVK